MSIALCMLVKDEINTIEKCLDPVIHLIDEVLITDTGSQDGTQSLIKKKYNIDVMQGELKKEDCLAKSYLRNENIARSNSEWILSLDADEQIDPVLFKSFKQEYSQSNIDGYFGLWRNHHNNKNYYDDYKLFMFKRQYKMKGLIHENVQHDIRENRGLAIWSNSIKVDHFQEQSKKKYKSDLYMQRLICAMSRNPSWTRYHWFFGYMNYLKKEEITAIKYLSYVIDVSNPMFPVEKLNSQMTLIKIYADNKNSYEALKILKAMKNYYDQVKLDFEVKINFAISDWMQDTEIFLKNKMYKKINLYRFGC
jgi:hypothetical protein